MFTPFRHFLTFTLFGSDLFLISGFPALKIGDEKEPNALKTTDVHSRPYEPIRTFFFFPV